MGYGNYPDLTEIKKILVIKLRHLGDVLLTAPFFSILKKSLPQAEIDAYIYAESLPMLEGHPDIHELIGYDRKWKKLSFFQRMKREFVLLRRIKKEKYDLVINLTEGDRGAVCARISKARIKVGIDPGKKSKRKIYTHIVKIPGAPRHIVEKNLDALRRIGIFPKESDKKLQIFLPEKAREKMRALLLEKGCLPKEYILIHPATRWKFKGWREDRVVELIQMLVERGEKVVLTSGPDSEEVALIERIVKAAGSDSCLSLAGKVDLKELGALIDLSCVCVCMDTAALHIASSLKAKNVVLFGPTSEKNWGPWQNPNAIVVTKNFSCRPCYMDGCGGSKKSSCLEEIEAKEVLEAIYTLKSSPK